MKNIWLMVCVGLGLAHGLYSYDVNKVVAIAENYCRTIPLKNLEDLLETLSYPSTTLYYKLNANLGPLQGMRWGPKSVFKTHFSECIQVHRANDLDKLTINPSELSAKDMNALLMFFSYGKTDNLFESSPNFYRQFLKIFYSSDFDFSELNGGYHFFDESFEMTRRQKSIQILKELQSEGKLNKKIFSRFNYNTFRLYKEDKELRIFFDSLSLPVLDQYKKRKNSLDSFLRKNGSLPSAIHLNKLGEFDLSDIWSHPSYALMGTEDILESSISDQFIRAMKKEKELAKAGYVTFYHGQAGGYAFMSDMANMIYNEFRREKSLHTFLNKFLSHATAENDIEYEKSPADFFFLQFQPTQSIEEAKEMHETMLAGRNEKDEPIRIPHRVSLNLFAFGNSTNMGSSTFFYANGNKNVRLPDVAILVNFFYNFGIPFDVFKKYAGRFENLMQEYSKLHQKGRLICFAFPRKTVNDNVYIAQVGAYKIEPVLDGKKVTTVTELLDVINKDKNIPFKELDRLEFATPLGAYGALNPHTGVKLFKFDDERADPKKLEVLKQEMQKLTQDIVTDLKNGQLLEKAKDILESREDLNKKIAQEQNKNNTALVIGGLAATAASSYGALKMYEKYKDQEKAEQRQPSQQPTQQPYQPLVVRPPEVDTWRARAAKWLPWFNRQVKKLPRA